MAIGTGRREVTEFFDEPLRGFVCERAAVQSAEFVLIQHMVKIAWGGFWVSAKFMGGGGGNPTLLSMERYSMYIPVDEYTL